MDELFSCVNIFLVTGLLIVLAKKQKKTKTKNKKQKQTNKKKTTDKRAIEHSRFGSAMITLKLAKDSGCQF